MSAYREAIDLTTATIDKRAKYYRNLVVVVVLTSLISIGWGVSERSFLRLLGFLLLFPTCGFFFYLDANLLNQWRSRLFKYWVKKEIDFCGLFNALNVISILPKNTLGAMLETLPIMGNIISEQSISSSTREAVTAVIMLKYVNNSDNIAFKVAGYSIASGSLILTFIMQSWKPLLGNMIVLILLLLQKYFKQWRIKKVLEEVKVAQLEPNFNQQIYSQIVDDIGG